MAGEKIGIDVMVATPELDGRIEYIFVVTGSNNYCILTADNVVWDSIPSDQRSLWERRIDVSAANYISSVGYTNIGDETIYVSAKVTITDPTGSSTPYESSEKEASAGTTSVLVSFPNYPFLNSIGTYKCEVKLYGRRTTTDTKTLLDTDVFYVHCYTEAIDIPAPSLPDYEYRTAETIDALASAAWNPVPTSLVINPNWWLQFRFNITNNGDEPMNIHIHEVMDSKSKIAMTVTDPTAATSLLPVYMKQIAPGTSKKIETLAMQLTQSGSWHFEGYVYAQRAYNRILDVTGNGVIDIGDAYRLTRIVGGDYDSDSDGYMTDADLRANNFATPPYWTHYAFANMDHVTIYDGILISDVATAVMTESELRTPPEDAFILQYDPFIIHAYGKYCYYNGSQYKETTNEDDAKLNAVSGFETLRIEDGKLITF